MPTYGKDIFKGIEFDEELKEYVDKYKDKQLSTAEMDLKIQADKIIYIINRSLAKLNMMAHLPFLLDNNAALLMKYLKTTDVHFILDLLNKFGAKCDTSTFSDQSFSEYSQILDGISAMRVQPGKYSKPTSKTGLEIVADPQVSQMIDLIFYNKCLRQIVNLTDNTKVDRSVVKIMKVLSDFKGIAKIKIYVTGEEEDANNRELRDAYKTNALITASVNELKQHVDKQRKELGEQLSQKVHVFEEYNEKMAAIKEDFQYHIKKSLYESERIMMHNTVENEAKQVVLAEEAKKITHQYEILLEEHLNKEKQSRSKRFKVETQLQNWLTKFDQDIGDRQADYEALKKSVYDDEKAEMTALQELFEEQEEEYDILMAEKAEEEERIFNEMAYVFLINRAARRIQRWWREYIERKKARRKARKGKGKGGKGGKGKNKAKEKPEATEPRSNRVEDPNALLEGGNKKFNAGVFDDIKDPNAFDKKDIPEL